MIKTVTNNIEKLERLTRRERLGELLVRSQKLTLTSLLDLMEEHRKSNDVPFGEFLVDKSYITRRNLIEFLNLQKIQDNTIDRCLEELGFMTSEKKWEILTRTDKLGEILVRQGQLKLKQLVSCLEQQETDSPEMLLGEIIVEKNFLNEETIKVALDKQKKENETILKTIDEITNISQVPIRIKIRYMNSLFGLFLMLLKEAILFKELSFPLISFLTTGYWLGEEVLTYYDDLGKLAQGDLLGRVVLVEHCKKVVLDELHTGIYETEFMYVKVLESNFNRKFDTTNLKNWIGWTTKHKKFELQEPENYLWIKKIITT